MKNSIIQNSVQNQYAKIKKPYLVLAILLLLIHFIFLMLHFAPAISTPDAQGYYCQAKLITREARTSFEPESPLQYMGPHWLAGEENRYYTTFPPGFPFIMAVVYKIFGYKATLLVNPLLASLALFGLFLLCRNWVGEGWALLAAALLAVNSFANEHALFGDSHTAVIFLVTWGLYFLARWIKTDSPWWAFSAGLSFGIIPTIRYPETLLVLAFGIYVLISFLEKQISWRSLVAGAIGVFIPIAALLIRNQLVFGGFWNTGYGLSSDPAHFGFHYFLRYSLIYLQQLLTEGIGLLFILGIVGIIVLIRRKNTRSEGILFSLLIVPITLLYMSYCWQPDSQSMRFLLPTFPVYIISNVWLLQLLSTKRRNLSIGIAVVLFLITVFMGLPRSLRAMQHLHYKNAILANITDIIEKKITPGSIIITYEGINQNLDFIGKWWLIDASLVFPQRPRHFQDSNLPQKKLIRNIEAQKRYANLMEKSLFKIFRDDVWQWAREDHQVFLVLKQKQIDWFLSQLSVTDTLETIKHVEIPQSAPVHGSMAPGNRPPFDRRKQQQPFQRLMAPNQIFDLALDGEPLLLVGWKRTQG